THQRLRGVYVVRDLSAGAEQLSGRARDEGWILHRVAHRHLSVLESGVSGTGWQHFYRIEALRHLHDYLAIVPSVDGREWRGDRDRRLYRSVVLPSRVWRRQRFHDA